LVSRLGALAANLTGTVDLAANAVQFRSPFSDNYKSCTTDWMAEKLGLDTGSFVFEATGAASLLVGIGSIGRSAGGAAVRSSATTKVATLPHLPASLAKGPSDTHVYFGVRDGKNAYVGIT
jgi:hypothetical protein